MTQEISAHDTFIHGANLRQLPFNVRGTLAWT